MVGSRASALIALILAFVLMGCDPASRNFASVGGIAKGGMSSGDASTSDSSPEPTAPSSSAPITQASNGTSGSGGNGGGYAGKVYLRFAGCPNGVSESELRSQADGSFLLVRQGCVDIAHRVIPAASVTVRGTVAIFENKVFDEQVTVAANQTTTMFYCEGSKLQNLDYNKTGQLYSSTIRVYASGTTVLMSYTYQGWDVNGNIYRNDDWTGGSTIVVEASGEITNATSMEVAGDGLARASIDLTRLSDMGGNWGLTGKGMIYSDQVKMEGGAPVDWAERNSVNLFCYK